MINKIESKKYVFRYVFLNSVFHAPNLRKPE